MPTSRRAMPCWRWRTSATASCTPPWARCARCARARRLRCTGALPCTPPSASSLKQKAMKCACPRRPPPSGATSRAALCRILARPLPRIVAAFGEESLEVIASQPEVLATVKGLTREKGVRGLARVSKMFGVREAIECLARWQLPASVAVALYRHYGPDTVDMLRHDPYLLCGYPLIRIFARQTPLPGSWAWNTIRSSACARALCMCCAII